MPDINGIPYVESTDLVSGWPTVSQSVAQEVSDQLASKVDYALPVNAQTGTTYTFVAADAEKLTTASNAAAVTLTIPPQSSVTWSDNTVLRVVNYGAGAVTIDGGSGVTVTNTSSTIAQYGAAVAIRTGSDAWTVVPFGGGDIPAATVSSPAATGQYTDTGITYDYYTFTSSGTLTVATAGFADLLVVGGGGGGGAIWGGGGGAGGYLAATDVYLPNGSLTVTVGAGGAGGSGANSGGTNGVTSRLDSYYGVGGAGGGGSNMRVGNTGGSGGGGCITGVGGSAASNQGNAGGNGYNAGGSNLGGGGGGGANAAGGAGSGSSGGAGGSGSASDITGASVTRAGGGGGGIDQRTGGAGGSGGSGGGGAGTNSDTAGTAGTANTGGGGGGGGWSSAGGNGGAGGSGVVIIRVKV